MEEWKFGYGGWRVGVGGFRLEEWSVLAGSGRGLKGRWDIEERRMDVKASY